MPSTTQASTSRRTPLRPTGPRARTLWEEGQHPGHLVVRAAVLVLAAVAAVEVLVGGDLGVGFDLVFVVVCVAAALWVRPRDFFVVGVLPPLLLLAVVLVLTFVDRDAVARAQDPVGQAVVSGLAHHAVALSVGYALTLAVLGLRQIAARHHGALRRGADPRRRRPAASAGPGGAGATGTRTGAPGQRGRDRSSLVTGATNDHGISEGREPATIPEPRTLGPASGSADVDTGMQPAGAPTGMQPAGTPTGTPGA